MENVEIAEKYRRFLDLIARPDYDIEEAFHDYTNSLRLAEAEYRHKLHQENAALRAAVAEMQRMLPVIEKNEMLPGNWAVMTYGTDVENANAYRQTLETALAQIEKNK